jgi:hypothetical protein
MTPRTERNTTTATIANALVFLAKAQELSRSADDALLDERFATTTLDAVHAGILAADAISAVRAGVVWKGEHGGAPGHLSRVAGTDGKQAANRLHRLLPLKNQTEYEAITTTAQQAKTAALAAQRIVAIAERCVLSVGGS